MKIKFGAISQENAELKERVSDNWYLIQVAQQSNYHALQQDGRDEQLTKGSRCQAHPPTGTHHPASPLRASPQALN